MGIRVVDGDLLLLEMLADCRVLPPEQLAFLCHRNVAGLRRRLKELLPEGIIEELPAEIRWGPGRAVSYGVVRAGAFVSVMSIVGVGGRLGVVVAEGAEEVVGSVFVQIPRVKGDEAVVVLGV